MPSFFQRYQVKHGHPIGEPSYWNRRLKDIDARIAANEDVRGDLEAVIDEGRRVFRDKANDVLLPLIQEVSEIANIGVMLRAGSNTEHNVTVGGKTFVVNEGERLRYAPPAYVAIYRMETPMAAMLGEVVAWDSGTGELVVDIDRVSGDGYHGGWTISPASPSDTAEAIEQVLSAVDTVAQSEFNSGQALEAAIAAAGVAAQKALEANASSGSANDSADRADSSIAELTAIYANQSQIYLGSFAADPITDLNGGALLVGAEYWNSADGQKKIYNGTGWTVSYVPVGSEVTSIYGRTGNIVAQLGDYSAAKITMMAAAGLVSVDVQAGLEEIKTALDAHGHEITEITDLQSALDAKSNNDHAHNFGDLNAKPTTIAGYAISDAYTKTELDGFLGLKATIAYVDQVKSNLLGGAPAAALDTILELGAELTNNGSAIASIVTTLATKSAIGHGHAIADVAGLQSALDGKSNIGHGHAIADITSLQTTLDAKLAASNYSAADVLAKIKTVDGGGSGLDADLLDGVQGSGYVQTSRSINSGTGLSGGGNLTADRTLTLDFNSLTEETEPADTDMFAMRRASDGGYRKVMKQNIGGGGGGGLSSMQVFTSSGTWNRPAGVTRVLVHVIGGGGGGGGSDEGAGAAGGGGSGGFGLKLIDVSAISSSTITIGSGGGGGSGATDGIGGGDPGNGSSGGSSSWSDGTNTITAHGGGGGGRNNDQAVARGGLGAAAGSGGTINASGNAGQTSGSSNSGGGGGSSFYGGGGLNDAVGALGGGGGGGDGGNDSGSSGGAGVVVVYEY